MCFCSSFLHAPSGNEVVRKLISCREREKPCDQLMRLLKEKLVWHRAILEEAEERAAGRDQLGAHKNSAKSRSSSTSHEPSILGREGKGSR